MSAPLNSLIPGSPSPEVLSHLQVLKRMGGALPGNPMAESVLMLGASGVSYCASQEGLAVNANTQTTLVDTTATPGPGVVDSIMLISDADTGVQDGYFRIYIDGVTTPISIQGHHFGSYQQQGPTSFYTKHIRPTIGVQGDLICCSYPIPFQKSIKIVYDTVRCSSAQDIWTAVSYRLGVSYPWAFGFSGIGYDNRLVAKTPTEQGNRTVKFLDLASGAGLSGVIAGITLVGLNSSNVAALDSWLENNVVVYQGAQLRDGSVVPAFNSSGTEDFFKSEFYFDTGEGNYGDMFVSSKHRGSTNNSNICMHRDLLHGMGGISFNDGCLFSWERGLNPNPGTSTTNIDIFYGVWYYLRA